jgi:hypothetical protein
MHTLRTLDWRMGGAIVARTGGSGTDSSSVFRRFASVWCTTVAFPATGRDSSSSALFGGLTEFDGGWLTCRLGGCALFSLIGGLGAPMSPFCEAPRTDFSWCTTEF